MPRSVRAFGLMMIAMVALSALGSSAASAAPKITSASNEYPLLMQSSQEGKFQFTLPGGRTFECSTAKESGTIANKAEAETSEMTVTPTYEGCTATILGNIDPVTVTMNGCTYKLSVNEEAPAAGYEYAGKLKIQCPTGKMIEIHVWENETKHLENPPTGGTTLCTYTIAEQGPLSKLDYRLNEKNASGEAETSTINATVSGIAVSKSTGTLTNCGGASQTATGTGSKLVRWLTKALGIAKIIFDPS